MKALEENRAHYEREDQLAFEQTKLRARIRMEQYREGVVDPLLTTLLLTDYYEGDVEARDKLFRESKTAKERADLLKECLNLVPVTL